LQRWITQQRYRYVLIPLCVLLVCAGGAGLGIWLPGGQAHASSSTTSNTDPLPVCNGVTIHDYTQGAPCNGQDPAGTYCWANYAQPVDTVSFHGDPAINSTTVDVYGNSYYVQTKVSSLELGSLTIYYSQTCGTNWLNFKAKSGVDISKMYVQMRLSYSGDTSNNNVQQGYSVESESGVLSAHTFMIYAPSTLVVGAIMISCAEKSTNLYMQSIVMVGQPGSVERTMNTYNFDIADASHYC
jgi:hypothetical protein